MSESQFYSPESIAKRLIKSIAKELLRDDPYYKPEMHFSPALQENVKSICAYGARLCKQKYGEQGPPSPESPDEALLVLHRGELDIVYCPWCQKIHWTRYPLCTYYDIDGPCQSLRFARGKFIANFPPAYHAQTLYDCHQRKEGVTDHRDRLMETFKRVSREPIGYYCETHFPISNEPLNLKSTYECVTEWKHNFNQHGIFLVRRRQVSIPEHNPNFLFREVSCFHTVTTIDFAQLQNPEANAVNVACFIDHPEGEDCHENAGQIHGCVRCVSDCLVRIDRGSSDSQDPPRTPKVIITTWYNLGKGSTPKAIDLRKRELNTHCNSPSRYVSGDIAKLSGCLEWGTS